MINKKYKRGFFARQSLTNIFIIVNLAVFLIIWVLIASGLSGIVENYVILKPNLFFQGHIWTVLTSMFSHVSFLHLFFNLISLFFIGNFAVERIVGKKRYFWFYLIAGVFAGLFYAVLSYFFGNTLLGGRIFGDPNVGAVGASGAIFGLVGLLAVLIPRSKVYLIAGPLIAIIASAIISISGLPESAANVVTIILNFYILISILTVFSFNSKFKKVALPISMSLWLLPFIAIIPLIIIGLIVPLPIGNTAHLGGLLIGLVYGLYLRNKYSQKVKMLSRVFR